MFDYPLFRANTIATNGEFPQFTKRFMISGIKDPCVIQIKANSDHCEFQRVHYVRILESMIIMTASMNLCKLTAAPF